MGANKTTISGASSYREIGEFWDEHDLSDYWNQTHDVQMHVDIKSGEVDDAFDRVLRRIRQDPCALDVLTKREFEQLIAELLAAFGWQVSLTTSTWDGGHDIMGITRDATGFETAWVVECKKYSRDRHVGVSEVRSLYATKTRLGVEQSLLVTSSFLSRNAQEFMNQVSGVKLADRDTILSWVSRYAPPEKERSYLPAQRFSSCFVSYSHEDQSFVERFVAHLRAAGVRVWFAPEDLTPGKKLKEEISGAIDSFDRLLLVLSANSMASEWVRSEIRRARKREVIENRRVLFPIALTPFDAIKRWELFDADLGQDLARELREYFIPDFSGWHNAASFEHQLEKVIEGLQPS